MSTTLRDPRPPLAAEPGSAPRFRAAIFDHGAGNLHSLAKAIEREGIAVAVEPDPFRALDADLVVLPGVGAFGPAAARLAPARAAWRTRIAAGLPCLGVCLGMQLLLESSDEGPGAGLGVLAGRVTPLVARRVPHMGWNVLEAPGDDPEGFAGAAVYFAHGYACRLADESRVRAWCRHEGDRFPAIVTRGLVAGVQFHPEKSSGAGRAFLARYLDRVALAVALAAAPAAPADPPCTTDATDITRRTQ